MNVIHATKFTNKNGPYYIGTLQFEEAVEVTHVSVIKTPYGGYLALAPKLIAKDGTWKSVINWKTSLAHKLVYEAAEAGNIKLLDEPVETNLGTKIGLANINIPCEVEVAVFIDKHGVPYIRLPGRQYSITDENGREVKKSSYFINLAEDVRNELAKQVIALAESKAK